MLLLNLNDTNRLKIKNPFQFSKLREISLIYFDLHKFFEYDYFRNRERERERAEKKNGDGSDKLIKIQKKIANIY